MTGKITQDIKRNQIVYFYEQTDWLKQKFITISNILKQHYFEFNNLYQGQVKISISSYEEKTTIHIEKTIKQNNINQLVEKILLDLSIE